MNNSSEEEHITSEQIQQEDLFHKLEVRYLTATKENDELKTKIQQLQAERDILALETASLKRDATSKSLSSDERETTLSQLRKKNEELHQDKQELIALLDKKDKESTLFQEEKNQSEERVSQLQRTLIELQTRINELESQESSFKFEQVKFAREKEALEKHNNWLNESLIAKTNELLEIRKDKTTQVFTLQAKIDEYIEEINHRNATIDALKKQNSELEKKLVSSLESLKEAKDSLSVEQESFKQEVNTQKRLQELYKEADERSRKRVQELETAIEEVEQLQRKHEESVSQFKEALTTAEKEKHSLMQENHQLKVKVSALESAQATSVTPQSPAIIDHTKRTDEPSPMRHRLLIDMQEKLEHATQELQHERNENRKLNNQLQYILKEIELRKYKEDYERLAGTHALLTRQLESAMRECDTLKNEVAYLKKEKQSLEQEAKDLSRQVQLLLKGSYGMQEEENEDHNAILDSDQIITRELLTFKNIEELQEKNRELVRIVRQLSDTREKETQLRHDKQLEVTLYYSLTPLQDALRELEELRASRAKHAEMVEVIIRQRDMYKVLLETKTKTASGSMGALDTAIPVLHETSSLPTEDYPKILKELQDEYENYRKEKLQNEKGLQMQLDKSKEESSMLKIELAKSNTKIDFLNERYNLLVDTTEMQRKELDTLRKKNLEFSTSLVSHQQRIEQLSHELSNAREDAKRLEVLVANLRAEKEIISASESRLISENQQLRKERMQQQSLLDNFQSLLHAKEKGQNDLKQRLVEELESIQRECANLKKQLHEERESSKKLRENMDVQAKELQSKLKGKEREQQELNEDRLRLSLALQTANQQIGDLKSQLSRMESQLSSLLDKQKDRGTSELSPEQQLQLELNNLRLELQHVRDELMQEKQNVVHYKAIAVANEEALKENSDVSHTFKLSMEAKFQEAQAENELLQKEIAELKDSLTSTKEIFNSERELLNSKIAQFHDQLGEARAAYESLKQQLQVITEREKMLQDDVRIQSQLAKDSQTNYERELVLHAADVQALSAMKEQLHSTEKSLKDSQIQLETFQRNMQSKEASWEEQKSLLRKQLTDVESTIKSLREQNDILHSQLETVTAQALKIQQQAKEPMASLEGATDTSEKTIRDLREVVRFLRSDKDILQCKYELLQQEKLRFQQQADHNTRLLAELEAKLRGEQERNLARSQTEEQHKLLVEQLQQLNLLRESNVMLRDENERNVKKVRELEDQVNHLKNNISPLQEEKKSLQAQNAVLTEEKKSLDTEIGTWKSRVQQLLDKYQRVDPETHKKLVEDHAAISAVLKERETELEAVKKSLTELQNQFAEEANKKSSELQQEENKIKTLKSQVVHWKAEHQKLTKRLEELQKQQEGAPKLEELQSIREQLQKGEEEKRNLQAQMETQKGKLRELSQALKQRNTENTSLKDERQSLQKRVQELEMATSANLPKDIVPTKEPQLTTVFPTLEQPVFLPPPVTTTPPPPVLVSVTLQSVTPTEEEQKEAVDSDVTSPQQKRQKLIEADKMDTGLVAQKQEEPIPVVSVIPTSEPTITPELPPVVTFVPPVFHPQEPVVQQMIQEQLSSIPAIMDTKIIESGAPPPSQPEETEITTAARARPFVHLTSKPQKRKLPPAEPKPQPSAPPTPVLTGVAPASAVRRTSGPVRLKRPTPSVTSEPVTEVPTEGNTVMDSTPSTTTAPTHGEPESELSSTAVMQTDVNSSAEDETL